MKVLLSIVLVFSIMIIANSHTVYAQYSGSASPSVNIPEANFNMTYKISFDAGTKDWNPISNVLVMADNDTLLQFAENGTQLAPLYKANFSMTFPRFNHDGTKIAFLNNYPSSIPADIFILDLQTRHLTQLTRGAHVFEEVWTPDDNIIYSQIADSSFSRISKLDTKNNVTSVLFDSIYNMHGFDISPNGTRIVISMNYTGQGCSRSYYASCYDHLFIYNLDSNKQNFTEIAKTDSYKFNVRWAHDGSFITYAPSDGEIDAITPDGKVNTSLIYPTNGPAYFSTAVLNQDQTIIAYDKGYGGIPFDGTFNPLNGGLYFTFTKRCQNDSCPVSVKSLPLLDPIQYGYDIYAGEGKSVSTYVDK